VAARIGALSVLGYETSQIMSWSNETRRDVPHYCTEIRQRRAVSHSVAVQTVQMDLLMPQMFVVSCCRSPRILTPDFLLVANAVNPHQMALSAPPHFGRHFRLCKSALPPVASAPIPGTGVAAQLAS
jgi:hypothetical protein